MAGEEGGIWAMPEDQTVADGSSTLPLPDSFNTHESRVLYEASIAQHSYQVPNTIAVVHPVKMEGLSSPSMKEPSRTGLDCWWQRYHSKEAHETQRRVP